MDSPEKKRLVSKRSVLGWGNIIVRGGRLFEQTKKRDVRYCAARFLHALNTSTALLNISFSLSGSKPKRCILASVVVDGSESISFAALL